MINGIDIYNDNVIYKPLLKYNRKPISKVIGLDTESYITGEPFMFCTSLNDVITPSCIPEIFFTTPYVKANFVLYNIKYDSGAILYHLPYDILQDLWYYGEVHYNNIDYMYIPKKCLRLRRKKDYVYFWDISQFFKMSLNEAAQTYLQLSKLDIPTKNFTKEYVEANYQLISQYCINDAVLTVKLAEYFIKKLNEYGIVVSKLYSCASISFQYFSEKSFIVTVHRFWKHNKKVLEYACDAYEGGKFEVCARGNFPLGYEYDITSAYPYEISNLIDISKCDIEFSNKYCKEAVYGYIRCYIDNSEGIHLPCGVKLSNGVRIYPAGKYYLTITKNEYDYIVSLGVRVEIISAVWLFVSRVRYPYKNIIYSLFKLKDFYKKRDIMLYNTTKIIMNSFYGKMAQTICKKGSDEVFLGSGWNPIYAAEITANTRIQVTRIQNLLKHNCLAVHTDSVITDVPLPEFMIFKGKLGEFEFVDKGRLILIACGMYQINNMCAYRGIESDERWDDILKRYYYDNIIKYPVLNVRSWIDVVSKGHSKENINVFENNYKEINLNCDIKRVWTKSIIAKNLLEDIEYSIPKYYIEDDMPKHWKSGN